MNKHVLNDGVGCLFQQSFQLVQVGVGDALAALVRDEVEAINGSLITDQTGVAQDGRIDIAPAIKPNKKYLLHQLAVD